MGEQSRFQLFAFQGLYFLITEWIIITFMICDTSSGEHVKMAAADEEQDDEDPYQDKEKDGQEEDTPTPDGFVEETVFPPPHKRAMGFVYAWALLYMLNEFYFRVLFECHKDPGTPYPQNCMYQSNFLFALVLT